MNQFWKSYFGDKGRLVCILVSLVIFSLLFYFLVNETVLPFILGYIVGDPLNYYIISYRKTP